MKTGQSIAVIGLGFVGLPLSQLFVKKGHKVFGIDVDQQKISQLHKKTSYLTDLQDADVAEMMDSGRFIPTDDFSHIKEVQAIIICVPTPLINKEPDLSYVRSAIRDITPFLQKDQLIVIESSTYPGTTEEMIKPMLEKLPFTLGKNLYLGYSPERIDPGNDLLSIETIPKVISGVTDECLSQLKNLYSTVFQELVPVSSPRVAEFTKMLENSQRLINISFINEINLLANKMKINLWEVIEAAKTKPVGFTPYYPGPGVGGHCIPVDPFFLTWVGMREGVPLTMIHHAGFINELIPHFITNHVVNQLEQLSIALEEAHVGVIGITYKKDVNDIRESAALKVVQLLLERQIKVSVCDPVFKGTLPNQLSRFEITEEECRQFALLLILVDHSQMNWDDVVRFGSRIIDTRNVITDPLPPHVVRL